MISQRIQKALETNEGLQEVLQANGFGLDWKKFNRTVFDFIARKINRSVSEKVIALPFLLYEKLVIGKDQLQKFLFEKKLKDEEGLLSYLANQRTVFPWISGKTLQSYWNNGKAKDTKINVLLVFIGVEFAKWDEWKSLKHAQVTATRLTRKSTQQELIRNYFLGSYFLFYQKSDGSGTLIKAPFTIELDDTNQIIVQTITEGHLYRSSSIELRDGILYIHCENQVFNEKENHIFNVGNETNPEVLFGISNTISVKSKLAIGIRNVLVRQKKNFTPQTFVEREILLDGFDDLTSEEETVVKYFQRNGPNLMHSESCCTMEVLKGKLGLR
jgi:hypothetical protein